MSGHEFIDEADRSLDRTYEAPRSLAEYVDLVLEQPRVASHASKYLLNAIEAAGTRTVIEEGEQKERYRFFDDPENDGEHAILGNTEVLNAFVDDLRSIAAGRGKDEKIVWLDGPTATGKSELKRCLINGLREYSKTDEGRRYTVEFNVAGAGDGGGLTYADEPVSDEDDWYESPVQSHPLTVFPEDVREDIVDYDRIYLPGTTLQEHGVTEEQIASFRFDENVAAAVQDELRRTEQLYREGVEGIKYLPADCRFGVLLSAVLYAEHHRQIRGHEYDVLSARRTLTTRRRLWLAAKTWLYYKRTGDPVATFEAVSAVPPAEAASSGADKELTPNANSGGWGVPGRSAIRAAGSFLRRLGGWV